MRNDDHDDPDAIARRDLIRQRKEMALQRIRAAAGAELIDNQDNREEEALARYQRNWRDRVNRVR